MRFGLLWNTASETVAAEHAMRIASDPAAAAAEWAEKRAVMLEQRIDVGAWMMQQVREAIG